MFRTYSLTTAAWLLLAVPAMLHGQQTATSPVNCSRRDSLDHTTMDHAGHLKMMAECARGPVATSPGQAAYAAIAEIVRMLESDEATDWSKVNVEVLRQHLIDMDDVTMRAMVSQRPVPGGLEIDVAGAGRTVGAIQRMVSNHARMLEQGEDYHALAEKTPRGVKVTVTAKRSGDARMVARIRGLGFAGLLTEGEHHAAHHLALARGQAMPH